MESLVEALKKVEEVIDEEDTQRFLSILYNSMISSDFKNLEELTDEIRSRINSLSVKQKRYLCNIALDRCVLPVLQLLFSSDILDEDDDDIKADEEGNCSETDNGKNVFANPYHIEIMYTAIRHTFPEGIKLMCDGGAKFDSDLVHNWCMQREAADQRKNIPVASSRRINKYKQLQDVARHFAPRDDVVVYSPGINKYKQIEDIARHFASRGDVDMLERMLGKNEEERSKAQKYIKNVEQALVSAIDVDDCDDVGEDRALKCVEMFVSAGADVNKPASRIVNGFQTSPTPLMMAAFKGKPKIFEYLIQNGADVNRRDHLGENVLHYLINSKQDMTDCVDRIFSAGYKYEINTNKMIRIIYTPLHLAVVKNKIPLARKLIDQGADIFSLDRKGKNLIHQLAEIDVNDDSLEFAEFLIKSGLDKDLGDEEGHTPLFDAIKNKNTVLVKFLLEQECKIDTLCAYSTSSPLLMACDVYLSGQEDILLLLLDSKCDVNFANDRGIVALMKAAEYPSKDLASLLLKHGADVNKQDSQGRYATSYCFEKRGSDKQNSCTASEMLTCLMDTGLDIRKHNKDNQLLYMALIGVETGCFSLLVDLLETYDEVTRTGETIFHFFARSRDIDLKEFEKLFATYSKLSEQKNKNGFTPLMMAAYLLNEDYLNMVTKYGQDVNICNKKDHTALHFCIIGFTSQPDSRKLDHHNDFLEYVRLLIEAGADVDAQDKSGRTALMMAAILMDEKLIALLLEMGAEPEILDDEYGISALQLLSPSTQNDSFWQCLRHFVSYGCDYALDVTDTSGTTLIQRQFRLITEYRSVHRFLPNIYLLLSTNCCIRKLSSGDHVHYFTSLNKSYFDLWEREKLRKLLFLCGADVDEILKVCELIPEEEEDKCSEKFKYFCNNITLRSRCRRVIRQSIGGNIKDKLRELSIPPGIHDFLLVKDDCLVEDTAIPGKYFDYKPVENSKKTPGSEDGGDDTETTSFRFDFEVDCEDNFNDFYEFFRWYSFSYIDEGAPWLDRCVIEPVFPKPY